jgi:phenylpropionate dioxygenase-like ring-hydroxylating dioxygenase large terminal subunit
MGEAFDSAGCRLPEVAVEVWRGWVYVNADADAAPLLPRIADLDAEMANYHMEEYRTLFVTEEVWDTNWKCLIENFGEAYHVFCAHPGTIEPAMPTRLGRYRPGGEGWFRYEQARLDGVAYDVERDGRVLNGDLTPEQRATYPIACVLPAHLMSISEDRLFWLALQPVGVGQVRVRWGVAAYPGAVPDEGRDEHIARIKATLDKVNAEDRGLVENIYRNAASRFAASGKLAPLERCVWEFGQYVSRRLCGV